MAHRAQPLQNAFGCGPPKNRLKGKVQNAKGHADLPLIGAGQAQPLQDEFGCGPQVPRHCKPLTASFLSKDVRASGFSLLPFAFCLALDAPPRHSLPPAYCLLPAGLTLPPQTEAPQWGRRLRLAWRDTGRRALPPCPAPQTIASRIAMSEACPRRKAAWGSS